MHYAYLIDKVKDKLHACKGKMLPYGVKEVPISSVIQRILIYTLYEIVPPASVIKELHKIFAILFWSNKESHRSKYWSA